LRGDGGVMLFHTHPSSDPTPSSEDSSFTLRMAEAAGTSPALIPARTYLAPGPIAVAPPDAPRSGQQGLTPRQAVKYRCRYSPPHLLGN
jgi:proteasome lid subunit RPN8/RPN11